MTLSLMSIGTISIACVPGYATIGLLAPILVVVGRLVQGFSAGVELGGVSVYLSEIATPGHKGFYILGPPAYWLVTAMFNVFPLPRQRDFQRSFAHAGKALDHGYNVMVFPEGTRSAEGQLARFRPGIGLLAKQSYVPVLPVAIRGLSELVTGKRHWFRSGTIEVHIGEAIWFGPEETEAAITERLHAEVDRLMGDGG